MVRVGNKILDKEGQHEEVLGKNELASSRNLILMAGCKEQGNKDWDEITKVHRNNIIKRFPCKVT